MLKRIPRCLPTHKIGQRSTHTTFGYGPTALPGNPLPPLEPKQRSQHSVEMADLSIFQQRVASNAMRNTFNTYATRDCECGVSTSPKVRSCLPLASSPLSSGGHADQRTQVLRHRCMPHQMGSTANRSFDIFLRLTPRAASALKHSQWHPRTCARFCTLATKQNAQPNQYSTSKCPLFHF